MNNYSYSCLKVSYVDTFYPSVSIDLIPKRLGRGRFKLWKRCSKAFPLPECNLGKFHAEMLKLAVLGNSF